MTNNWREYQEQQIKLDETKQKQLAKERFLPGYAAEFYSDKPSTTVQEYYEYKEMIENVANRRKN